MLVSNLGYTDYKEVNGVPAQLVGDTYLPSPIRTVHTGKGWYEVYSKEKYIGYLRPGGPNGRFIKEGSNPIDWSATAAAPAPTPAPTPAPAPAPTVTTTPVAPTPVATTPSRTESIPVIGTPAAPTPLAPPTGGPSIIELPGAPMPITDAPSNTAADAAPTTAGMSQWMMWSLIGGAALVMLKGKGKKRAR